MNIIKPSVTCTDVKQYFQDLSKEVSDKYKSEYNRLEWTRIISYIVIILTFGISMIWNIIKLGDISITFLKLMIPQMIICVIAAISFVLSKWKLKILFNEIKTVIEQKRIPLSLMDDSPFSTDSVCKVLLGYRPVVFNEETRVTVILTLDKLVHYISHYQDLENIESLNNLDEECELRYDNRNEDRLNFKLYINSHYYDDISIRCDGIEEFKKAANLDFSYIDEHFQWLNDSCLDILK